MEHIKQLKNIRDEALQRLQSNADYKLLTSLDSLIVELEGVTAIAELAEKTVAKESSSKPSDTKDEKGPHPLENAFEKLGNAKKANGNGSGVVDLKEEVSASLS